MLGIELAVTYLKRGKKAGYYKEAFMQVWGRTEMDEINEYIEDEILSLLGKKEFLEINAYKIAVEGHRVDNRRYNIESNKEGFILYTRQFDKVKGLYEVKGKREGMSKHAISDILHSSLLVDICNEYNADRVHDALLRIER